MQEKQQTRIGLPLPKWCFVLLGIPTFCLPLVLLALAAWVLAAAMGGRVAEPPDWTGSAAYHCFVAVATAQWLVYLAWIAFSKRLTGREKALWLFAVTYGNVIGMPMFYVFMLRRYLGLEGRTGTKDEAALERFLARHGIGGDRLSADQLTVLLSHCRRNRLAKWALVPWPALAAILLYMATTVLPQQFTRICISFAPTHPVIIGSATDTKKEFVPEPEHVEQYTKMVMTFGGMAGILGTMGLFMLVQAPILLWVGGGHRRALIEFLKVTGSDSLPGPPA